MTQREPLPNRREHVLINFTTADGFRYTAGLGYFDDGRLAEILLNAEKVGTGTVTTSVAVPVTTAIAAMIAEAGIVRIQAHTMRPAMPHRTADRRLVAPTPTMEPVMVWVVETGMPKWVAT